MTITTKGQVTIPLAIRERLGLLPHTRVEFTVRGKEVALRKAAGPSPRGRRLIELMRGRGGVRMSTDAIMNLTREN